MNNLTKSVLGYEARSRIFAFMSMFLATPFIALADHKTWSLPAPGGSMDYTVNRIDAKTVTVTCNNCSEIGGPALTLEISFQAGSSNVVKTPGITAGQTSVPMPAPCTLFLHGTHFIDSNTYDYTESGDIQVQVDLQSGGVGAAGPLAKTWLGRLLGYLGEPVQLASGAESSTRTLFSLYGARNWDFELHYNSDLACAQTVPGIFGCGWTNDFEARITQNGNGLYLNWDATSANVFNPVAGQSGVYSSTEDASRYDTITTQPGGGWLLLRKDQSSKLFNASGQLVQDIDTHGRILQLSYSGNLLASIVEPISGTSLQFSYDSSGTVSSIEDSSGAIIWFTYDAVPGFIEEGPVITSIMNQNGFVTSFTYGNYAVLSSVIDNFGKQLLFNNYDGSYSISSQIDGLGNTSTISRDEEGTYPSSNFISTVSVTDRAGNYIGYTYDANFNLLEVAGSGTPEQVFTYDSNNQMLSGGYVGNITQYTYDSSGNLLTSTDPLGNVTTLTYDARNNPLTITDAAGRVTTFTYDAKNNITSLTNAAGGTTTWTYDGNSLPLTKTLPNGGVYQYAYTEGLLSQVTDPIGVVSTYGYDMNGRIVYSQESLGKRCTFTYDAMGNVLTAANALGQTYTYTYDYRNRVSTVSDPSGATTTYAYDNNSNLLSKTDALGKITTYTYDADDHLITAKDALGRTTTFGRDSEGKLLSVTDPAFNSTTYNYDAADRLSTVSDPTGAISTISYDARRLPTSFNDPLNRVTTLTYDNVGRRLTVVDPLNRTTQTVYDALNRLAQVTDPGLLITAQGFDADSNRTAITDPNGNTTSFVFDAGDRITTSSTPAGRATSYAYDARGLPSAVTLPSGHVTTYNYDDAERISSIVDGVGTRSFTRDNLGRVLTVTENGKTLTRTYDALGHITSYVDGAGNTIGYQYDAIGRLTTLTYPGGRQVSYTYNSAGDLWTVTDWKSRVTTYTYDADHRVLHLTRPNGTTQNRTYDLAGQLTKLTELAPDGVTVIYAGTYGFDAAGQLTNETLVPAISPAPPNHTQTFDTDDRLLTHVGAATTIDLDGNLLSIASGVSPASYNYDARNRLTSAGSLSYTYDAESRRVTSTDGTGTTQFVVNPNAALDQVLIRTTPDGTTTYYVFGLGLLCADSGSLVQFYHFDQRGNTVALTDLTGAITDSMSYDAYGAQVSHTGTSNTPFMFNGFFGVQTDSNGLYFCRARYYHPQLKRWLNTDPIGLAGGQNLYAFVGGDPINRVDPFGLCPDAPNSGPELMGFDPTTFQPLYRDRAAEAHNMMVWDNRFAAFGWWSVPLYGTGVGSVTEGYIGWSVGEQRDLSGWERAFSIAVGEFQGVSLFYGAKSFGSIYMAAETTPQILANNAAGKAAEVLAKADLEAQGYTVLGSNVTARTSQGIRFIDHLVDVNGDLFAVEVKSGGAFRSSGQLLKDIAMEFEGATLSGPNVPASLQGQVFKIPTVEMHY
jgi:RHS repeat-associated protein